MTAAWNFVLHKAEPAHTFVRKDNIMDYTTMSLVQLRELAKAKNLKKISTLKKAELIERLQQNEKAETDNEKKDTVKSSSKETGKKYDVVTEPVAKPEKVVISEEKKKQEYSKPKKVDFGKVDAVKPVAKPEKVVINKETEYKKPEMQQREYAKPDNQDKVKRNSAEYKEKPRVQNRNGESSQVKQTETDGTKIANGILEVMPDNFGFIRCANYLPGDNDVYVSPAIIRRFNLRTGDILEGEARMQTPEKFGALVNLKKVNGYPLEVAQRRPKFEELIPIFPNERIHLENRNSTSVPMRIMDLLAPVGKGQRGMIVSPPKAGKTTLLKQIAKSISRTYRDMVMIVLLIDERPEEVTDIRESIEGPNVEVIYSTFDELPEHHKRVSEMVLERAKRLVEHGKDVVILLDSITRLARAYNLTVPASGRTLSGGLDPAALHMPKKFFGAARNVRNGGSLTILATALVETGSKMDDVVFEEFKGTGNMELVLDRALSEKRIFPAIDVNRSGTRRDDLLLSEEEQRANYLMHREMDNNKTEDAVEEILRLFTKTKDNKEFVNVINKTLDNKNRKK